MQPDNIAIIGGGESILRLTPAKAASQYENAIQNLMKVYRRAYTIGVNDSMVRLQSHCHEGVSMDRRWTEWRINEIRGTKVHLRRFPENWKGLFPFKCDNTSHVFSEEPGEYNGQNSGYCAFNRAYQLRPKRIFLFGFDMGGDYWYPPYPWTLKKNKGSRILSSWREGFAIAKKACDAAGIQVYIVGESSIEDFTKISFTEFLKIAHVQASSPPKI